MAIPVTTKTIQDLVEEINTNGKIWASVVKVNSNTMLMDSDEIDLITTIDTVESYTGTTNEIITACKNLMTAVKVLSKRHPNSSTTLSIIDTFFSNLDVMMNGVYDKVSWDASLITVAKIITTLTQQITLDTSSQ